jgi:hypothetical protein
MSAPDYLVCLDCETPCYTFEFENEKITEILCQACGNDNPDQFALPQELDDMAEQWESH